jgi:1,4-dihydroxy-2-naphthoate octaprenyltransferase
MEFIQNNSKAHPTHPKYHFKKALRPFSLPVALVTCGLGITAGNHFQTLNINTVFLILLAGMLLQAGVNLINDHADIKNPMTLKQLSQKDIRNIAFNYKTGWLCFFLCSVIGLYLVSQVGGFLLVLALIGGCGALFYTTEPINYKRRGLGVILVFFFMGVLMVYGAFFAATGVHHLYVIIISLPVSFLTSALLLSNELRDHASDKKEGLNTLTVRLGYKTGQKLYILCIILGFISIIPMMSMSNIWPQTLLLLPAALLAIDAIKTLFQSPYQKKLPPKTGKLYLVFGMSEIALLLLV